MNLVWLAADQPDEGERQANEAMEGWSHEGFHRQHYSHVLARIQTELYRGDAEAAWRVVAGNWPTFERTLLLRIQFLRIEASFLRARAALLNAARGRDVGRFLSIARKEARRIRRVGLRWSDAIAMLLGATVTYLEGRPGDACGHDGCGRRRVRARGHEVVRGRRAAASRMSCKRTIAAVPWSARRTHG